MEEKIYCFGIKRGNKLFALRDPIKIRNNFEVLEFGEHYPASEIEKEIGDFFEESEKSRGILFGFAEDVDKIDSFLKERVKLLSPDIEKEGMSIFFLEENQSVLFKFNPPKTISSREEAVEETFENIIKKFTEISRNEFEKETEEWVKSSELEDLFLNLEIEGFKISISTIHLFPLFVCVKPEDLGRFKEEIGERMKNYEKN